MKLLSLYQQHVEKWHDCQKCSLCHMRSKVVMARGDLPCDMLICGEAAGHSEDALGRPFCGPAGHLLDQILEQGVGGRVRVALTNLVCCIPLDEDGEKAVEPESVEILACGDRLREFVEIAKPRVIVAVGALPNRWLPKLLPDWRGKPHLHIDHPAFIIRQLVVQQGFSVRRAVITLRNAVEELLK